MPVKSTKFQVELTEKSQKIIGDFKEALDRLGVPGRMSSTAIANHIIEGYPDRKLKRLPPHLRQVQAWVRSNNK